MLISSKNALTEKSRMMLNQIAGHCDLAELTHKINHHRELARGWGKVGDW